MENLQPIGIKDTTKKDNYIISVGAVSFQLSRADAIKLAAQIQKMLNAKEEKAVHSKGSLISTYEYLRLQDRL